MKKRSLIFEGLIGVILSILFVIICSSNWKETEAKENGNLELKTVHSYEEIMEYVEGDEYFYQWNYDDHKNDEDIKDQSKEKLEETWTLKTAEPGWFMVFGYTSNGFKDNGDFLPYVFSNNLMTKAITRYEVEASFYEKMSGDLYKYRRCFIFYLPAGTYYFKMSTKGYKYSFLDYAVFLPFSDICGVDEIEYNEDYSEAQVTFKYVSDKWKEARFASRKNTTQDALDGGTYWDTNYSYGQAKRYSYRNDYQEFEDMLHEGITLTQNGDYSIYYNIDKGEYEGLSVMVNFTIDKIGQEASKVEAKSLKMSKKKATIKVGENVSLKVTFNPKNVTDRSLVWTSSNTKVATVDENGKVTAVKKGTCTITAKSTNGKKAKCKITVKK